MSTMHANPVSAQLADRRRALRLTAAVASAAVAVTYVVLMFLVRDAEATAQVVVDTTWGAYLFLAVPYAVGAVLLAVTDRRALWVVGALVQLVVIGLFVVFAVGVGLGPDNTGVFAYDAVADLPMELFAAVVTGLQVVLLGLLVALSLPAHPTGPDAGQPR